MMPDLVSAAEAKLLSYIDSTNAAECCEFATRCVLAQ